MPGSLEDRQLLVDRPEVPAPVRPDLGRLVGHGGHARLRVEAANDPTRGRGGAVPDLAVLVEDRDFQPTLAQLERRPRSR